MPLDLGLWILIAVGGTIGGLLYGMRDEQLVFPHMENRHTWNPGFLADILFGLAGGFIIFIIVPGSFDYQAGGWEIIQILALAGAGGYGGRAVVEKMINEQVRELEKDVRQLHKQSRWDAILIKLIDQHLDDDPDTPLISAEELKIAISSASSSAKILAFDQARKFRKDCLSSETHKHLITQVIPIFEGLIEDDQDGKYHRNHAQLAFVLKDMPNPDWKRAERELNKAIDIRNKYKAKGFLAYEFNRALCRIHLDFEPDQIIPDLEKALQGEKTVNWVRKPNPNLAPGLVNWLWSNEKQLAEWLQKNRIELPKE